jgi:WhiB family redox-sensing transcriptional regulator
MLGSSGRSTVGIKAPGFDGTQICAQTDPNLFFPDEFKDSRLALNTARKLCRSCEFKRPCLEYAINNPELVGVWAGTTVSQRQDIRTARNKAA